MATDLSYIPLGETQMNISLIMDWYTRAIMGYTLKGTTSKEPILCCVIEIFEKFGTFGISNSCQGSIYT
ncbi:MAG: hypothetical protein HUJ51_00940 [Eggerthellaceae bacterium]|nr:hypothetical protein [Eggerthellaceae bacterium]